MSRFKERPEIEQAQRFWYRFKKGRLALVGLAIVMTLAFLTVFAYQIAPYPEDEMVTHVERANQPPSHEHPFGTDDLGRDVLSRILIGARVSIPVGIAALAMSTVIGISMGLLAGTLGGFVDWLTMRLVEIFLAIPPLVLALTITVLLTPSLESAMFAISVSWWPGFARLVRTEAMRVKASDFVEAARSIGAGGVRIAFGEILPNVVVPIIVRFTLNIGYAILTLAMLGFLGLGVRPPMPEWGSIAGSARYLLPEYWWTTMFASFFVFLTVFSFNILGDGFEDAITEEASVG